MLPRIHAHGRLGSEPKQQAGRRGEPFTTFSVACSKNYIDTNGEKQQLTEWLNIVARGATGKAAFNFLKKGAKVFIEGELRTRIVKGGSYDGQKFAEVHLDFFDFLDSKGEGANFKSQSQQDIQEHKNDNLPDYNEDDLPF